MEKDDRTADEPYVKVDQGRGPEDGESSRDETAESSLGKRKYAEREREPESPGKSDHEETLTPHSKKEKSFYSDMEEDSPASYPKHVLVPSPAERPFDEKEGFDPVDYQHPEAAFLPEKKLQANQAVLTPDSTMRARTHHNSFEGGSSQYFYERQPYQDIFRAPSYQDMDYSRTFPEHQHGTDSYREHSNVYVRPRRWACDYCNVATFLSYEEACAHEETCTRRLHRQPQISTPYGPAGSMHHARMPPHSLRQMQVHDTGLGALYHAGQEVVTPPTPHSYQPPSRWGSHGPPLPVLPHDRSYYRQGYYDARDEPIPYNPNEPSFHQPNEQAQRKRLLLAMSTDPESLSDRQCFVRSDLVEIFAATEQDVAARHSKGAQKLEIGQVGLRCMHCAHLRPRDRAERAVCYPSSISRIYQTVADMQRFHFEHCREVPRHVLDTYKSLRTTRPRGVGSPQSYWIESARNLGLVDTENGIRYANDPTTKSAIHQSQSEMTVSANYGM